MSEEPFGRFGGENPLRSLNKTICYLLLKKGGARTGTGVLASTTVHPTHPPFSPAWVAAVVFCSALVKVPVCSSLPLVGPGTYD